MWPFKPEPFGIIDWIEGLRMLPAGSVDSVVTSPPYWNLRDYGVEGQFGMEPTMEEYLKNLCDGFDEVRRVLKDTGTCWVNLGDTYNGSGGSGDPRYKEGLKLPKKWREVHKGYPRKSLCLIPQRFVIEMVDNHGWIARNVVIWYKRNCMPTSAKDRFTVDYEDVFFFTKKPKYYFEQQLEPCKSSPSDIKKMIEKKDRIGGKNKTLDDKFNKASKYTNIGKKRAVGDPSGRNKRCVWDVNPQPYKEAHFATYPPKLIEPMIKAGCPEFVCNKCGMPREKIVENEYGDCVEEDGKNYGKPNKGYEVNTKRGFSGTKSNRATRKIEFKGWSDCGCDAGFRPGIVLDPFVGRGTTITVARYLRRIGLGFDLDPKNKKLIQEYANLIQKDLEDFE